MISCILRDDILYLIYSPHNFFVMLFSCFVFIVMLRSRFICNIGKKKVIQVFSDLSLAIYVLHPFIINFIYKYVKIYPDFLPQVVGELMFFIFFAISSFLISIFIKKLPLVGRLL